MKIPIEAESLIMHLNNFNQGRKEGVKGMTVSRGPGLKRGPEISITNEKLGNTINSFILGFWGPETLRT
jgi:hypothetical protein